MSKDKIKITPEFISAGCNRCTGALKVSRDGLCAFGADTMIALCNPFTVCNHISYIINNILYRMKTIL